MRTALLALAIAFAAVTVATTPAALAAQTGGLPTIRRTEHGVAHILADDFRGIGIGLGYAQVEDYGERVILGLLRSKGWMGRTFGRDSLNSDFGAARDMIRVRETYHTLDAATRDVYEGFAEGVNIYIRSNSMKVPEWAEPVFHAHDVAALDIQYVSTNAARNMVLRQLSADSVRARGGSPDPLGRPADEEPDVQPEDGSNAWAFAPSRTKSGRAILLRNPHLNWNAGYWEAHVTVPGKLDFYGDFRIGSAFAVIGGFNKDLGWATTNNAPDNEEVYALGADAARADHYLFDGVSVPLTREDYTVDFSTPGGMESETRSIWITNLGPVAYRTPETIYVVRAGNDGEYRAGQQFLRMMRATSLADWKAAMAMQARSTSNITYADRAGNIFNVWNATTPNLPLPSGGDTVAVSAKTSADVWNAIWPFEALPQTQNPKSGYVHNENSAPYYANLRAVLDTAKYPPYFERPSFSLRSQHAISLIESNKKHSLEDVVRIKHSYRMLLADRVKGDLLRAARAVRVDSLGPAIALLAEWDNTAAPDSRGAMLFEAWWTRYSRQAGDSAFAELWTPAKITTTPRGLGNPAMAVEALGWAAAETQRTYGAIDVQWGDVHRVRRGQVDVPVGGCSGVLGCFRVLNFGREPDGKRIANGGDGWVLAVEFGKDVPRAYSVLAYGQSPDSTSAYHDDQAAMFAKGELKPVRFTQADVLAHAQREYVPGRPQR
ncbi:MAG: penicillin acylase family protein [Gemmatimonadetes bacterium]|nr:penicillin acylase family protein [Gemmatimonadota bacterium]